MEDKSATKKQYDEYLKSPQWQAKRSERLKMDNYTCQRCGYRKDINCYSWFEIHHLTYKNVGNEDVARDLITLCPECHKEVEAGKGAYTYKNLIAKYREKLKELVAEKFCVLHKRDDISGGGDIDLCKNEVIRPLLEEYQKSQGLDDIGENVKQVNDYFRDKRYEVMEKIFAKNPTISAWKMHEITGFKYQMVDKWLKRKKS